MSYKAQENLDVPRQNCICNFGNVTLNASDLGKCGIFQFSRDKDRFSSLLTYVGILCLSNLVQGFSMIPECNYLSLKVRLF